MSVNVFHRDNPRADMLERIATNGQKVFLGTKEVVDNAIKNKDIGNNCIVYITDDYDEKLYPKIIANDTVNAAGIPIETPAGTIIYSVSETPPEGYLKCDGTQLDVSTYPRLAKVIGVKFDTRSVPVEQKVPYLPNQLTADGKPRALYGADSGSYKVGTYIEESLPNIKGMFKGCGYDISYISTDGPFYLDGELNWWRRGVTPQEKRWSVRQTNFDASRTTSGNGKAYKNGANVFTNGIAVNMYIKY